MSKEKRSIYGNFVKRSVLDSSKPSTLEELNERVKNGFELKYIDKQIELGEGGEDEEDEGEVEAFEGVKKVDRMKQTEVLISFKRFVNRIYPFHKKQTSKNLSDERIQFLNRQAKQRRVEVAKNFLDLDIGKRFRRFRDKLYNMMKSIRPDNVIPAFYELLNYLHRENIEFKLVFRTFGDDIKILVKEFNRFCCGTHRRYEGVKWMENKKMDLDDPKAIGHMIRTDEKDRLVLGCIGPKVIRDYVVKNDLKVLKDPQSIHDFFVKGGTSTVSQRDHYHYWNMNGERSRFGKVLVVDTKVKSCIQMFFDDNIVLAGGKQGIIDLQDVDGNHLSTEENLGLYLHWVSPLRAILDDQYFTKLVKETMKRIDSEN